MSDIPSLLKRAASLSKETGRSEATVSKWLFGDANTIKRLRAGRSCTVSTLLRAQAELAKRETALKPERPKRVRVPT